MTPPEEHDALPPVLGEPVPPYPAPPGRRWEMSESPGPEQRCRACGWEGMIDDWRGGVPAGVCVEPHCPRCGAGQDRLLGIKVITLRLVRA